MNLSTNDSCKITISFIRLGGLVVNLQNVLAYFLFSSIGKARFYISFTVRDFFDF